jgi:hypothetical protein
LDDDEENALLPTPPTSAYASTRAATATTTTATTTTTSAATATTAVTPPPPAAAGFLGFDVLLQTHSLTPSQVNTIRQYFASSVTHYSSQPRDTTLPTPLPNETEVEERLRYESEWISIQGYGSEYYVNVLQHQNSLSSSSTSSLPLSSSSLLNENEDGLTSNSVGNTADFIFGLLLGFLLGFVVVLWIWIPSVSYKRKLGLCTGLFLQMLFSSGFG